MDLRKIKKLIELLEDSALLEMEITEGDSTIRLSRTGGAPVATRQTIPALPVDESQTGRETPSPVARTVPPSADEVAGIVVNSPMVGTFFNASSPDSGPYVSIGTVVEPGDALCIIEAMKTYNQLEAEVAGTVKAIYKKSGDPVEFGEPLFLIA